ncbi:MAG: hypothetical protein JXR68_12110 [Bacteroidales bacterium]|nr:hypothetical protein [Bacteroidales bacterium]
MLKFNNLKEILRDGKTPFLKLYTKKNSFEKANAGSFDCENCETDLKDELKVEKAIEWLEFITEKFEPGTVFLLTAAKYQKSNQTGISGPFEFKRDDLVIETENVNNNNMGINGFEPEKLGYMRPGEVEAKLLSQQLEFNNLLHAKQIEDIQKDYRQSLENIEASAKAWNPETIKGILKEALGGIALLTGKAQVQPLAGIEEKEPTLKELLLQEFTDELKDLELNEITIIKNSIHNLIKNKKSADNGKSE